MESRLPWLLSVLLWLAGVVAVQAAGRPVVFSVAGGVYTNELTLELRAKAAGATVRYTVDGSEPGPDSPSYREPIAIRRSAIVRARTVSGDGVASDVVAESYHLLAPDLWAFESNLPVAILGTFGREIGRSERLLGSLRVLGDAEEGGGGGRVGLRARPDLESSVLVNHRGRASTRYPKRSFTLKLVDDAGEFQSAPILGLPKDADWVLYAPYPDKTLMRDALAYELSRELGRWAPRTRFIELFVQEEEGLLSREHYVGVYVLVERVKRDGQRVDITRLEPDDNAGEALTGGYLFKKDHSDRNIGQFLVQGYAPFEAVTSSRIGFPTGPGAFPGDPEGFLPPYRGRTGSGGTSSSSSRTTSSSSSSSSRSTRPAIVTNILGAPVAPKKDGGSRSVMIDEDGNETVFYTDDDDAALDVSFKTTVMTNRFYFVDPEPDEITGVQRSWLMRHLDDVERALAGPEFKDPRKGYAAYLDADAFIDYHLLVEVTKNVDGFRFSTFYHKDRGGKIRMGPLWDWNLSFGNCNGKQGYMPERWLWPQLDDREYSWFRRLFEDPDFGQRYVDRWAGLRSSVLATSNVLARVDRMARELEEAQRRNFERWPILGVAVHPNWYSGETYAEEVGWMKDWITKRLAWIEAQFVAMPKATRDGAGKITLATDVAGPEIYYTVDGTDPRASGGGVSGQATRAMGAMELKPAVVVLARARSGERWSGLTRWTAEGGVATGGR